MAKLHLYVPDDVVARAKASAKAAGKSLSSYLADLVVNELAAECRKVSSRRWPAVGNASRSSDRIRAAPSAVTTYSAVSTLATVTFRTTPAPPAAAALS
jgi:hypothetical protein